MYDASVQGCYEYLRHLLFAAVKCIYSTALMQKLKFAKK